jgi:hypothetical protein
VRLRGLLLSSQRRNRSSLMLAEFSKDSESEIVGTDRLDEVFRLLFLFAPCEGG